MSYRVHSTQLKNVTFEAFASAVSESRVFLALAEVLAWAAMPRRENIAVVVEEGRGRSLALRSAEDAARSVV